MKTFSARHINQRRGTPGVPVGQHNYYDEHVIRNERVLDRLRAYIAEESVALAYGPGKFSLSSKAKLFPMLKIQTVESLRFWEKWDFLFLRGWIREKRRNRDIPNYWLLGWSKSPGNS